MHSLTAPEPKRSTDQKSPHFCIKNARIVLPDNILENGQIEVFDGMIQSVSESNGSNLASIDGTGCTVIPGIIDVHSDALEKFIQPRKGAQLPLDMAIFEFDKTLAGCGITTMFHCIALMNSEWVGRSMDKARETMNRLITLDEQLLIHSKIHVRYDLPSPEALPCLLEKIAADQVHLVSLMDHTPGQGQYRDLDQLLKRPKYGNDPETARIMLEERIAHAQGKIRVEDVRRLTDACHQHGITVASHDDESIEKVRYGYALGARINEFPVTLEAAREARLLGQPICMGAPNALRGSSHSGNLSAREAIQEGLCDILCSDYAPMALLHTLFLIADLGILPLAEASNLVSLNPAKATGMDERTGSIEAGKQADLVLVDTRFGVPRVRSTFVRGRAVYQSNLPPAR
jgi:alpha-D-ribose 1-methylphosphonate 5-triphosphate diphosphatase